MNRLKSFTISGGTCSGTLMVATAFLLSSKLLRRERILLGEGTSKIVERQISNLSSARRQ
ncbi:hypothetical protein IE4803_PB00359 (plasmid) [Rhizobium etli bv. phaseoli str. IE4803]|nr:hypothetical protein IE4803_PB00359 [Rhizobium etli bv. phaseoli str. IE4803]